VALQVIGAGLGRTGTASLKVALEQLGIGRCYHMTELHARPTDVPHWLAAADGAADWDQLFAGYGATVDYAGCTFWRELAAYYPQAKILLSVRDSQAWFESTQATIFAPVWIDHLEASPQKTFLERTVTAPFGERIHERDFMIRAFEAHVGAVERTIPAERLLKYDVKAGWTPLCRFLDLPVPDVPFPCVNTREDTRQLIQSIMSAERASR
jgi:hypothetical protein